MRLLAPFRMALGAVSALLAVDMLVPGSSLLVEAPAHAVVGRPLTPVSVAGVARRTTRRTVAAAAMVAPAPQVVVAPAPQVIVVPAQPVPPPPPQ